MNLTCRYAQQCSGPCSTSNLVCKHLHFINNSNIICEDKIISEENKVRRRRRRRGGGGEEEEENKEKEEEIQGSSGAIFVISTVQHT